MREIRKGDIIQLQRKGYYICDLAYRSKSEYSGLEVPIVLILIPNGSNRPVESAQTVNETSLKVSNICRVSGSSFVYWLEISPLIIRFTFMFDPEGIILGHEW